MGDEQDSWFKPFGFDPGKFAEEKLKAAEAKVSALMQEGKAVVEKVESTISDGAKKVVSVVADGPAAASGSKAGGGSVSSLGGSVGAGGANNPDDVKAVQAALGLGADGNCGGGTVSAIKAFQKSIGQANPDGRVDPGGATARALASGGGGGVGGAAAPATNAADDSEGFFEKLQAGAGAAKDFGGKLLNQVQDEAKGALEGGDGLGGGLVQDAKSALADPGAARSSLEGNANQDLAQGLIDAMKNGRDLSFLVTRFKSMSMEEILDVMTRLKNAGKLDDFQNRLPSGNPRVAVAMLTVKPDFKSTWKGLVTQLNEADKKAVLARTPNDVRIDNGFGPEAADPASKAKDDEEQDGQVTIENVFTVQGKLTFNSKAFGPLGNGEATVKLSKEGDLKSVEVELELVKAKLKNLGKLGPILDLEAKLTLNAEAELKREEAKLVFDGVSAKMKGEIEVKFKGIPVLKTVSLKFALDGGTGGFSFTTGIEIPIPGS